MLRSVHQPQPAILEHRFAVWRYVPWRPHQWGPRELRRVYNWTTVHAYIAADVTPRHGKNLMVLHGGTGPARD